MSVTEMSQTLINFGESLKNLQNKQNDIVESAPIITPKHELFLIQFCLWSDHKTVLEMLSSFNINSFRDSTENVFRNAFLGGKHHFL